MHYCHCRPAELVRQPYSSFPQDGSNIFTYLGGSQPLVAGNVLRHSLVLGPGAVLWSDAQLPWEEGWGDVSGGRRRRLRSRYPFFKTRCSNVQP